MYFSLKKENSKYDVHEIAVVKNFHPKMSRNGQNMVQKG